MDFELIGGMRDGETSRKGERSGNGRVRVIPGPFGGGDFWLVLASSLGGAMFQPRDKKGEAVEVAGRDGGAP